jgi:hypothetical protein
VVGDCFKAVVLLDDLVLEYLDFAYPSRGRVIDTLRVGGHEVALKIPPLQLDRSGQWRRPSSSLFPSDRKTS